MGDVKLVAAICSFLGSMSISFTLPCSAILGSILGVTLIFIRRGAWGTRIPYGPFLGLSVVFWLLCGWSEFMHGYWANVAHAWNLYNAPMIDERLVNPGR
jgi:prepilin signal peptidase PulO-like enzyme (type II secretory pathway)